MKILVTLKPENYMTPFHQYGMLVEIDWEKKKTLRILKIPAACFQDDRAFMSCCVGGLCRIGKRVFVAAWNFVVEVDYDTFEIANAVSWPPMADLHGMAADGETLWVASTGIDAVLGLDAKTLELKWRWGPDEPILYEDRLSRAVDQNVFSRLPFLRTPLESFYKARKGCVYREGEYRHVHKSKSPYHYHHLNGITLHEGQIYVTTKGWNDGQRSAVIRVDPRSRQAEFFVPPGGFRGMHDGVFVDGRFYATESGANSVAIREADGRIAARPVDDLPYFVRGLCFTGQSFLVGYTTMRGTKHPAKIVEWDRPLQSKFGTMELNAFYGPNQGTAIHSIVPSPV